MIYIELPGLGLFRKPIQGEPRQAKENISKYRTLVNSFGCSCHSLAENNGASGEAGAAGTEGADFTRTDSDT